MALVLSEEQDILKQTAREWVASKSPLKRVRELMEAADGTPFSRSLWREMGELGWLGIVVPEQYGGAGMGWRDLMVVMEELGRGLVPEPMLGTALLGAQAILLGGAERQRAAHLPRIVAGEEMIALAFEEPGIRFSPLHVGTRAEARAGGFVLRGEKTAVLDGSSAEWFVVTARTSGGVDERAGITLFLVPRTAAGVDVVAQRRIDGRGAAIVRLENVMIESGDVLGEAGAGADVLERVLDRATIALSAEMLGSMGAAFAMTLEYLKTRVQFGKPIGSFQALKHRAARMFIETELARSVVMAAHAAIDDDAPAPQVTRLAAIAKARMSDAGVLIGNETVQMHGGIGMTDEHDAGLFLKRARVAQLTLGDAAYHRARVAQVDGY